MERLGLGALRWNGEAWEVHKGCPIGHVYLDDELAELEHYRSTGLTPEQITEMQREIADGEMVRVVRCKDCASYVNGVCNLWSEDEFDATNSEDGFCNYAHYVGEQTKRELKAKYDALMAYDPYGERRKPE